MHEIIKLPNVDLSKQRMLETKIFEIELFDDYFTIAMIFKAEEPDPKDDALPWMEVDNDFEIMVPRHKFAGLEKVWLQEDKRWKITISIDGLALDIRAYFKKRTQCQEVFDKLKEYFIKNGHHE